MTEEIMDKKANDNKRKMRLGLPFLIGAAGALTFCFFSVTEVFAGNRAELLFNLKDFIWWILLAAFCVTVIAAALIAIPRGKAGRVIGAVFVWLTVMGWAQGTFLNASSGLAGDDREAFELGTPAIINLIIWIAVLAGILFAALKLKVQVEEVAPMSADKLLRVGRYAVPDHAGGIAIDVVVGGTSAYDFKQRGNEGND